LNLFSLLSLQLIANSTSPHSEAPFSSSSLLHPFLKGINRLEILALPLQEEALPFFNDPTNVPLSTDLVLAINWEGRTEDDEEMVTFWIPSLLYLLRPSSYDRIGVSQPTCQYLRLP